MINLKPGKTESMLLGTARKLSTGRRCMNLFYRGTPVCVAESYKCLGTIIDPSLTLSTHFDKQYKRASTKLRLLEKLRSFLTKEGTKAVFHSVIQPSLTFNSLANLALSNTQRDKIKSLDRRASVVLNNSSKINTLDSIYKQAVKVVKKCMDGNICENYQTYFELNSHGVATRNGGSFLKIPKVKLEFAKKGFYFQGVKLFNSLPIEVRLAQTLSEFQTKLKDHTF